MPFTLFMAAMNLTAETLFELLRLERARTELQALPALFSEGIGKLASAAPDAVQRRNIMKIMHELHERREKKLVNMAIDKSRTPSAIVDFSKFLPKERELFESIVTLLDSHRERSAIAQEPVEQKKDMLPSAPVVRFLRAVPLFVGPDMAEYGPFDQEEIASLPRRIADVL